ncbi:OLC1v1005065C1 [Oldenlandia corymbosa var. corymbosa]|uniref:OLC1v1005065C1 n=1 Tax=Oldenlandia corymbosa var. corymbosa TaxID=529605 RepID=A0AAV1DDT5_OLDCO|nr:OLC1v1005065C1 [Oldenlandia corymbosa var. corymbosa]
MDLVLGLEARKDGNKVIDVKGGGVLSVDINNNDKIITKPGSNSCGINDDDKSIDQFIFPEENQDTEQKDDKTESSGSSSFGDAASDESQFSDDDPSSRPMLDVNEFSEVLRKPEKKPTSRRWNAYIRPVAWRCKWADLQFRKLQNLAKEYDTKLADLNRRKPAEEGFEVLMERKKRRRVEDTVDPASYFANHPVFSYFECIKKNQQADGNYFDEELKGKGRVIDHHQRSWLGSGVEDDRLNELLRKIDFLRAQARDMKSRLGKVTAFACTDPNYANPNRTLVIPSTINEDRMIVGSSKDPSLRRSTVMRMQPDDISRWTGEDDVLIYDERLNEGMKNYGCADLFSVPMEKKPKGLLVKEELESTFHKDLSESEITTPNNNMNRGTGRR